MGALARQILLDSPVAYWPMDETSGTTLVDRSGSGRNGTFHGGISANTGGPAGLACLAFDGASGTYIDVADDAAYSSHAGASGVWSYDIWLYRSLATTQKTFLNKGNPTGPTYEWLFEVKSTDTYNHLIMASAGPTVMGRDGFGASPLNQWHHVGASYDRNAQLLIVYNNGVEISRATTASGTSSDTTGSIYIGTRNDAVSGAYSWNGRMAQLAIYNTVLAPDRFMVHYQAGVRSGVLV